MKYTVIYADPPWCYDDKLTHHGGSAESHYPVLKADDLADLPVGDVLADDDCLLFLWCTHPQKAVGLRVMEAWGFQFKTVAQVWVKLNQKKKGLCGWPRMRSPFFGLGRWARGNTEELLLGVRGKPQRQDNAIRQLLFHRRLRHSAKPACTRARIVRLAGDVPRIELFARDEAPGWTQTGLDFDGRDIREYLNGETQKTQLLLWSAATT